MKYRVFTNGRYFKIQRERLFGWVWLDTTNTWCNWYGKDNPKLFSSIEEIKDFIKKQDWYFDSEIDGSLDWKFDSKAYLEYDFYKVCAKCGMVFYDKTGLKSPIKKKGVKDEMECQDGSGYWYCSNCKNRK